MQQKTFTKYLFAVLFLLQLPMAAHAEDKYRPVAVWPFIYEDFTDARILVGPTNKVVKAKANIHLYQRKRQQDKAGSSAGNYQSGIIP